MWWLFWFGDVLFGLMVEVLLLSVGFISVLGGLVGVSLGRCIGNVNVCILFVVGSSVKVIVVSARISVSILMVFVIGF